MSSSNTTDITLEDLLAPSTNIPPHHNQNIHSHHILSFRQQSEFGQRKRIKP